MSNLPPGNPGLAQPGQISLRCGARHPPLGASSTAAKEGKGGSQGSPAVPRRKSVCLWRWGEDIRLTERVYSTLSAQ